MFEGFATTVVETAGAELFVRYRGEGEPVVLLHGHPRTSATWHKVAPLLVNCGYRVICADPETWYRPKADAQTMGAENHAELMSAVREPGVVRAMPEDYRAGLALDRVHEEQEIAAPATHSRRPPSYCGHNATISKRFTVIPWRSGRRGRRISQDSASTATTTWQRKPPPLSPRHWIGSFRAPREPRPAALYVKEMAGQRRKSAGPPSAAHRLARGDLPLPEKHHRTAEGEERGESDRSHPQIRSSGRKVTAGELHRW